MKNAMQLKAIIKNLAKEKHISAQLVMLHIPLERNSQSAIAGKLSAPNGKLY